jgi:hypothetical protein
MRGQPGAAEPTVGHVLGELAYAMCAGRQIDVQDRAHVAEWSHAAQVNSLSHWGRFWENFLA